MAVDFATFALLAKPLVRQVFETVVNERSIRFNELLRRAALSDEKREEVKAALRELKGANLINEIGSVIDDFNTYYVTAAGLELHRKAGL
jgi:hypothetical protein